MVFVSSISRDFSEVGGRALGDSMSPSSPLGYIGKVGLCTPLSVQMVSNSIGSQYGEYPIDGGGNLCTGDFNAITCTTYTGSSFLVFPKGYNHVVLKFLDNFVDVLEGN